MADREVIVVWEGRDFRTSARPPTVAAMAPVPHPLNEPEDDIEVYVGLARQDAEDRARTRGWSTVRSLAPGTVITMEYLGGRLNFEVRDGRVHRCWKG